MLERFPSESRYRDIGQSKMMVSIAGPWHCMSGLGMSRMVKRSKSAKRRRKIVRPRRGSKRTDAIETALASLAHEIRTPLNGILAFSELIAAADLPEREREWAAQVKGAAEHLAQLASLVIDGVRAEGRGLVLRQQPFRPRALAECVAATLSARAQTKGLLAEIAIATDLPPLAIGDAVRLRAALENLADNAVKFTDSGSVRLAVGADRAARKRQRLSFEFTDSGIGLSRSEIARLFRPFAQANVRVARRYGGAGLGLALVRRLAKAMGGDLEVESRSGRGSTFRLTVMVGIAEKLAGVGDSGVRAGAGTRSLHVLCAEDNPFARVVLKTVLIELGHEVDFAGTGEATLAAVQRGGYDLVLMDVALPGMNGIAATRAIRALDGAASGVPIIGVSGHTEGRQSEAALAAGMNAFLAKPVSPAVLAETVASLDPGVARRK
jgi:CheY-like chemotaxis protein